MTLSAVSAEKALNTRNKIKVLVVDDSALIRSLLTEMINSQKDMVVVAAAPDPIVARELIKQHNPDVITLDVEMPKMDGLDFLERLMRLRPTPVVMVSTLTEKGSEITLRALELGAIDFVTKPKMAISSSLQDYKDLIADKIRTASQAKLSAKSIHQDQPIVRSVLKNPLMSSEKLIIIGSSTGGTEAVKTFLLGLPADCPGVLVTQHMPAGFTKSFAARLNSLTKLNVKEAEHGERVMPGCAYIAPGDRHMRLNKSGANYTIALSDEDPVSRHRPSVDVLFESAAQHAGKNGIGLILTGMGKDGAEGMFKMKQAGSYNFAQDENSCVVFGMPKEAIAHGGVDQVVDIKEMAVKVIGHINASGGTSLRV